MCRILNDPASAIRLERPTASAKQFNVRTVHTDHFKSSLWVLVPMFMLSSLLLLIPGAVLGGALCMAVFGGLALLVRRGYRLAVTAPVVLEAYDDGLWFNRVGIFVPYGRLVGGAVDRFTTNGLFSMRLCRFSFLVSRDEARRIRRANPLLAIDNLFTPRNLMTVALPGQDGVLSPGHEEIQERVRALAGTCAQPKRSGSRMEPERGP